MAKGDFRLASSNLTPNVLTFYTVVQTKYTSPMSIKSHEDQSPVHPFMCANAYSIKGKLSSWSYFFGRVEIAPGSVDRLPNQHSDNEIVSP